MGVKLTTPPPLEKKKLLKSSALLGLNNYHQILEIQIKTWAMPVFLPILRSSDFSFSIDDTLF